MRASCAPSVLLLITFLPQVQGSAYYNGAKWHCGINKVTETISEWLAKPFDYHGVNQCCQAHDEHYYHQTLSREDADTVFCNCLDQNLNWFVRNLIEPLFCKSVQAYAIWQKVTEENFWTIPTFPQTTTTTTTTSAATTTRSSHSYNNYFELIRQRERELKKQALIREQEKLEELEKSYKSSRNAWFLKQEFRPQRFQFPWN